MKKLAIFFPGVGYTKDKPLIYYSSKMADDLGYECIHVSYRDLPEKIRGDKEKMILAGNMAYKQSCRALQDVDFGSYVEVLLVGKSIGTIIAAKYAAEHDLKARLVLYTPIEATFAYEMQDAVAFIGEADPWSDLEQVKALAKKRKVPLYTYPGCNHSLEIKGDQLKNIQNLSAVMSLTYQFIKRTGSV